MANNAVSFYNLSYSEVYSLTPFQLRKRIEGIKRSEEMKNYRTAMITTTILNVNRSEKSEAVNIFDLFNFEYIKPKEKETQTPDQIKNKCKALFKALGGK